MGLDAPASSDVAQPQALPDLHAAGSDFLEAAVSSGFPGVFAPIKFWVMPVEIAVMNPAVGRMKVITGSSMAQETAMESTPDSGVAIMNESAAPSFAPCFFKPATTGITPQLHSGMGMPNNAEINTGLNLPAPKYFFILSALK